ncbi:MAG: hypothetical protein II008_22805, partial [Oscillospiraceae bacterium]|nr:hypothetical protein [Oscillospiraceae bacterium]
MTAALSLSSLFSSSVSAETASDAAFSRPRSQEAGRLLAHQKRGGKAQAENQGQHFFHFRSSRTAQ